MDKIKVVCINIDTIDPRTKVIGDHQLDMTIGKTYEINTTYHKENTESKYYVVIDDIGDLSFHKKERFLTLKEYRNSRINKIID